ncbi:major capsid protein [Methylobacillus sp.]|uniref:major capsid protein n=1 Tax=Methylobacillus sp. TaxID=56818 RepID=UPI0012D2847C|nr:hypothetical protein [Methylobacillus sp.]MPS48544.1 phage major capsid protein [Methylobacillus sp.]
MALLKEEAAKLSNNQLEQGIIEEIIEKDQMFSLLPFARVNGKAYVYNRESTVAENNITTGAGKPGFVAVGGVITEGAVPFKEVTTHLRILAGDVDVDKFLQETQSDTNDQMAVQIAAKAKAIGRLYHDALANGSVASNPNSFDGIRALLTNADSNPDQTIGATTTKVGLSFELLDALLDKVPEGADAIIMRRGTLRSLRVALRAQGGSTAQEVIVNEFGQPQIAHNGVPILINDYLPTEGAGNDTCSVYAARLNEVDGLHGLYGGAAAGIRVESVGTVQNKDADRIRLKWYSGLALKSTKSLARLAGITNI